MVPVCSSSCIVPVTESLLWFHMHFRIFFFPFLCLLRMPLERWQKLHWLCRPFREYGHLNNINSSNHLFLMKTCQDPPPNPIVSLHLFHYGADLLNSLQNQEPMNCPRIQITNIYRTFYTCENRGSERLSDHQVQKKSK